MAPAAIRIGAGPGSVERFRHLLDSRSRTGVANKRRSESCWRLTTRSGRCSSLIQLEVNTVESGCGGEAVAFRYEVAMAIGGPSLLQAVNRNAFIAPGGTGCGRRISDGSDRQARYPVDMLEQALP